MAAQNQQSADPAYAQRGGNTYSNITAQGEAKGQFGDYYKRQKNVNINITYNVYNHTSHDASSIEVAATRDPLKVEHASSLDERSRQGREQARRPSLTISVPINQRDEKLVMQKLGEAGYSGSERDELVHTLRAVQSDGRFALPWPPNRKHSPDGQKLAGSTTARSASTTMASAQAAAAARKMPATGARPMGAADSINALGEFKNWAIGQLKPHLNKGYSADDLVGTLNQLPAETDIITEVVHSACPTINPRDFTKEFLRRKRLADKGLIDSSAPPRAPVPSATRGTAMLPAASVQTKPVQPVQMERWQIQERQAHARISALVKSPGFRELRGELVQPMNHTAYAADGRAQSEKSKASTDLPLGQDDLRRLAQSFRFDLSYERQLLLVVTSPVEKQWKCLLEMMYSQSPERCIKTLAALEQRCGIISSPGESDEDD